MGLATRFAGAPAARSASLFRTPSRDAALICRVAGGNWRLDRVYFLAFLNPSQGQPDPALTDRLASPGSVGPLGAGTRGIYRSCRARYLSGFAARECTRSVWA